MPILAGLQSVHAGAHGGLDSGLASCILTGFLQNFEPTDGTDGEVLDLISFQQQFALNRILWLPSVCVRALSAVSVPNRRFKSSDLICSCTQG